ncbi:Hypothetical protein R9X50_00775500 [Acrodontium crateriforme]|uniref:Uncharacterized protein n=1 Tax=Acrodontium crateriforme TaxID=150365 RepID=A0AAQ3REA6_9PEZI|nr:Hypothetical protein R9X50_00775500 [Acrodontium crateriforme]
MDVLRSVLPRNTGYSLVEGGRLTKSKFTDSTLRQWLVARGKAVGLFAISLTLLIFYNILPHPASHDELSSDATFKKSANFHVVMPVVKADENVCRFVVSGGVLGYPAPIFTNWSEEFDDPDEAHVAKVKGLLDWTNRLDASHDDDLALVIESHDVWMQLRPQNLIDRYFEINRRADRRLKSEFGDITRDHDVRQDIVFAGQGDCEPWSQDDPGCYAIPTSILESDLTIKPKTSTWRSKSNKRIQFDQPHLNAAIALGTVKAMRKLFEQAMNEIDMGTHLGSNQNLFSHIYGKQELWREVLRRDTLQSGGLKGDTDRKARNKLTSNWNEEHLDEIRTIAAERENATFEFGIGVDYASEISLSTAYAQDNGQWIKLPDSTTSTSTRLSNDIANALPPFWTFSVEPLPRWTTWHDVPLYTYIPTTTTPALLHLPALSASHPMNQPANGAAQSKMWSSMFFHRYARVLFDAFVYAPVLPVATSGYDVAHQRDWWTMDWAKAGMHKGGIGGWTPYGEFCQEFVPGIFGDGKGEWSVPDWN